MNRSDVPLLMGGVVSRSGCRATYFELASGPQARSTRSAWNNMHARCVDRLNWLPWGPSNTPTIIPSHDPMCSPGCWQRCTLLKLLHGRFGRSGTLLEVSPRHPWLGTLISRATEALDDGPLSSAWSITWLALLPGAIADRRGALPNIWPQGAPPPWECLGVLQIDGWTCAWTRPLSGPSAGAP